MEMAGRFPLHLPATLKHLSVHISPFNCKPLCLIVSQLSIPGDAKGGRRKYRAERGGWQVPQGEAQQKVLRNQVEPLLHQSQGSGFPTPRLEPAGESIRRGSLLSMERTAVFSSQVSPLCPLPPRIPALPSIQPICLPPPADPGFGLQPPCPRDTSPAHLPLRQLR